MREVILPPAPHNCRVGMSYAFSVRIEGVKVTTTFNDGDTPLKGDGFWTWEDIDNFSCCTSHFQRKLRSFKEWYFTQPGEE